MCSRNPECSTTTAAIPRMKILASLASRLIPATRTIDDQPAVLLADFSSGWLASVAPVPARWQDGRGRGHGNEHLRGYASGRQCRDASGQQGSGSVRAYRVLADRADLDEGPRADEHVGQGI